MKCKTKCWLWGGKKHSNAGYARVRYHGKDRLLHVFMWELLNGTTPAGKVLDHLCRNTLCFNPQHVEPVTQQINVLRGVGIAAKNSKKAQCPQGHFYDSTSTRSNGQKYRKCSRCHVAYMKNYHERKKSA